MAHFLKKLKKTFVVVAASKVSKATVADLFFTQKSISSERKSSGKESLDFAQAINYSVSNALWRDFAKHSSTAHHSTPQRTTAHHSSTAHKRLT